MEAMEANGASRPFAFREGREKIVEADGSFANRLHFRKGAKIGTNMTPNI